MAKDKEPKAQKILTLEFIRACPDMDIKKGHQVDMSEERYLAYKAGGKHPTKKQKKIVSGKEVTVPVFLSPYVNHTKVVATREDEFFETRTESDI